MNNQAEIKFDDTLIFILSKTVLKFKSELGRRVKAYGVTPEQWALLHRLWEHDGLNQKELAKKILKDQSNITRILDKLGKKGLIRRIDDAEDRRAFHVFLTDDGRELVKTLLPIGHQVKEDACRGFSGEEIEHLKTMLNKIWKNL